MDTFPTVDEFWQNTIRLTRAEHLDALEEPIKDPQPFRTFRITYRSFGGVRITARLGVPIVKPGTRLPAIITAPGYGGWEPGITLSDCQRGVLVLQVFPRGQGESREAAAGDTQTEYLLRGIHHPAEYFYRGAFMDLLRGVDYLLTRPDVAPDRIGAMGTSQGGGLVLSSSALEPRIRAVTAHLPFFCDMAHNAQFRDHPLAEPQNLRTFAFFDPITNAPKLNIPVLLSSGGRDEMCPTETIRAVFDRLSGIKALIHYPDLIHTASPDYYRLCWDWMDRHL